MVCLLDGVTQWWLFDYVELDRLSTLSRWNIPPRMGWDPWSVFFPLLVLYIYRLGAVLDLIFFAFDDESSRDVTPLVAVHPTRAEPKLQ